MNNLKELKKELAHVLPYMKDFGIVQSSKTLDKIIISYKNNAYLTQLSEANSMNKELWQRIDTHFDLSNYKYLEEAQHESKEIQQEAAEMTSFIKTLSCILGHMRLDIITHSKIIDKCLIEYNSQRYILEFSKIQHTNLDTKQLLEYLK